jgi:hypothetical protein
MRVRVLGPFASQLPLELSAAIERLPVVVDDLGCVSVKRAVLENRAEDREPGESNWASPSCLLVPTFNRSTFSVFLKGVVI